MTADIVNLRRARKAKQRQDAGAKAAENRAKFGRTKHARATDHAEAERAGRHLDALRLDPVTPGSDKPETD